MVNLAQANTIAQQKITEFNASKSIAGTPFEVQTWTANLVEEIMVAWDVMGDVYIQDGARVTTHVWSTWVTFEDRLTYLHGIKNITTGQVGTLTNNFARIEQDLTNKDNSIATINNLERTYRSYLTQLDVIASSRVLILMRAYIDNMFNVKRTQDLPDTSIVNTVSGGAYIPATPPVIRQTSDMTITGTKVSSTGSPDNQSIEIYHNWTRIKNIPSTWSAAMAVNFTDAEFANLPNGLQAITVRSINPTTRVYAETTITVNIQKDSIPAITDVNTPQVNTTRNPHITGRLASPNHNIRLFDATTWGEIILNNGNAWITWIPYRFINPNGTFEIILAPIGTPQTMRYSLRSENVTGWTPANFPCQIEVISATPSDIPPAISDLQAPSVNTAQNPRIRGTLARPSHTLELLDNAGVIVTMNNISSGGPLTLPYYTVNPATWAFEIVLGPQPVWTNNFSIRTRNSIAGWVANTPCTVEVTAAPLPITTPIYTWGPINTTAGNTITFNIDNAVAWAELICNCPALGLNNNTISITTNGVLTIPNIAIPPGMTGTHHISVLMQAPGNPPRQSSTISIPVRIAPENTGCDHDPFPTDVALNSANTKITGRVRNPGDTICITDNTWTILMPTVMNNVNWNFSITIPQVALSAMWPVNFRLRTIRAGAFHDEPFTINVTNTISVPMIYDVPHFHADPAHVPPIYDPADIPLGTHEPMIEIDNATHGCQIKITGEGITNPIIISNAHGWWDHITLTWFDTSHHGIRNLIVEYSNPRDPTQPPQKYPFVVHINHDPHHIDDNLSITRAAFLAGWAPLPRTYLFNGDTTWTPYTIGWNLFNWWRYYAQVPPFPGEERLLWRWKNVHARNLNQLYFRVTEYIREYNRQAKEVNHPSHDHHDEAWHEPHEPHTAHEGHTAPAGGDHGAAHPAEGGAAHPAHPNVVGNVIRASTPYLITGAATGLATTAVMANLAGLSLVTGPIGWFAAGVGVVGYWVYRRIWWRNEGAESNAGAHH
jgi:hypothetical protein